LSQQQSYTYKAYSKFIDYNIYNLLINSSGISDIGRVLKISNNTVCSRILKLSKLIKSPKLTEVNQNYEVDELFASPTKKYWYVAYAINRSTNEVINFSVGRRTKENLDKVIHSVLKLSPKKIYTDKLPIYMSLIPTELHCTKRNHINRIERFHLNLRTHIKRLHRKSICYSKNLSMLEAVMKLYFWGHTLKWNI
jgi:IS1 family transposase